MRAFFLCLITSLVSNASEFADYWYAGKAEVAVYDLDQSRYGESRPGTVSLIFVTEPFSKKKHVKLDNPAAAGKDKATVLKLNITKKYNTGIYPYAVMTSAFADVQSGRVYKASNSMQEWCGHVYSQLNDNGKGGYKFTGHSYFESEGEQSLTLDNTTLQEEIMLAIRLGKLTPATTKMTLVPSQETVRNLHLDPQGLPATLKWEEEGENQILTVDYDHPADLETKIIFQKAFPHVIQSWSESFTRYGQRGTTTATLKALKLLPYWSMNSTKYDGVRKELGLE